MKTQLNNPTLLRRQASAKARNELLECIKRGTNSDASRVSEIVAQLSSTALPFNESLLGGGPWEVVYTEGAFLWQIYTSPGKILLGRKNAASQAFNPSTRAVLNAGEIAGENLFVTATGEYTPQDSSTTLPKDIDVRVDGGTLHVYGKEISLPIHGRGEFAIAYLDDTLRIFRAPGGRVSVQVKKSSLDRLMEWEVKVCLIT